VKLHGPTKSGQILEASGFCPAVLLAQGPLRVTLRAYGAMLGTAPVTEANQQFHLQFPLPDQLVGRPMMEVEIELDRVLQPPGDPRPLGLVFTTFTIK